MLYTECTATGLPASAATYAVIGLAVVNRLLQEGVCQTCSGDITVTKNGREYGIAVKLCLECHDCRTIANGWSSQQVEGSVTCKSFEVSVLSVGQTWVYTIRAISTI